MARVTLALVRPAVELYDAWLEAHVEWGPGVHEDGFGIGPDDEVGSVEGFAAWVARVNGAADRSTCRWIVEDGRVQGGIALRHQLNERTGHIGYGVRPSARGRGLATWALTRMLREAGELGIGRVLIVCADVNVASAKAIERCGGVLEEIRSTEHGAVRRYWVSVGQERSAGRRGADS
ncbi:GNAT family N-acetyltransferase [Kribbella sp. NPDC004875]|uniref:GNAT family N-acetyltransferase n=1 Tax=Kribbella sp. NPDC004875 TaxID=3364107 RepID=UPI00368314CA